MDQLRALSVFTAVAEEEGFAPAGRRMNLSPPTVTRTIGALEDKLGARLLHRTTRSVSLTAAGRRYYDDARRILAEVEEADRQAAGLHSAPRGEVSVTASMLFGRKIVAPILFDLLDQYPDISITTQFLDRVAHLTEEGIDIAVRIADLPDSSLSAIRVGEVRRVICAAPAYLDRRGRPRQFADLAHHDAISFAHSGVRPVWPLWRDGREVPVPVSSRLMTNTADVAIAAACAGRGLTRVLSYQVADEVAAGKLEIVMHAAARPLPVHVVHRETGRVSARVRAVVDHLVNGLRGLDVLQPM